MNSFIALPPWLKYSKNNFSLIFDMKGNIKDCNELLASISNAVDKENITAYFSEDEIIKLWNLLYTLNVNNNTPAHFLSQQKNGIPINGNSYYIIKIIS
jgi:hypothetical protein